MPQEVDYTIAWHPVHPSKINEALFGMFYQPQEYLSYGEKRPSKLTHNHCEFHFMLCHCVVDYSDIQ